MKKIMLLSLLVASFVYSQEQTVKFETEVRYLLDKQDKVFCISKKNPELILVKTPSTGLLYLMRNDETFSIMLSNGKIDYGNSSFKKKKDEGEAIDIKPTDNYENILNLNCQKFTFNENGLGFEVFIALNHKIDNTSFLYSNFKLNKESFNVKGLITKLNIIAGEKASAIMMIKEIRNSESKLILNQDSLTKLTEN